MMKIRESTWHYKFIRWHTDPPKNLCSYFWTLVGFIAMWFFLWWLFIIIWASVILDEWSKKKGKKPKKLKEPGILRAWISAKKQRVCTLIEFVE